MKVFVDSNVPMYVAGKEHPLRDPALRFMEQVRRGQVEACTSTEVLQEILFRYTGLGRRDLAVQVYDLFAQLCPVVFPVSLADTDRTRDLLGSGTGASVRDLLHAAVMLDNGVIHIATFDRGFDAIPGIERLKLD